MQMDDLAADVKNNCEVGRLRDSKSYQSKLLKCLLWPIRLYEHGFFWGLGLRSDHHIARFQNLQGISTSVLETFDFGFSSIEL